MCAGVGVCGYVRFSSSMLLACMYGASYSCGDNYKGFVSQACALIAPIVRVVFVSFVYLFNLVKKFIMCEGKFNNWNGKVHCKY